MDIKIFEIKIENYYLQNLAVFNNAIELDGILP